MKTSAMQDLGLDPRTESDNSGKLVISVIYFVVVFQCEFLSFDHYMMVMQDVNIRGS